MSDYAVCILRSLETAVQVDKSPPLKVVDTCAGKFGLQRDRCRIKLISAPLQQIRLSGKSPLCSSAPYFTLGGEVFSLDQVAAELKEENEEKKLPVLRFF